jgi:redox-sensitive bicupin YhaK (pirin superfamily)
VLRGKVALNGATLEAGDGGGINDEDVVGVKAMEHSEILLFDLA